MSSSISGPLQAQGVLLPFFCYLVLGDIVIAALTSEPMCERLHPVGKQMILMSENQGYPATVCLGRRRTDHLGIG